MIFVFGWDLFDLPGPLPHRDFAPAPPPRPKWAHGPHPGFRGFGAEEFASLNTPLLPECFLWTPVCERNYSTPPGKCPKFPEGKLLSQWGEVNCIRKAKRDESKYSRCCLIIHNKSQGCPLRVKTVMFDNPCVTETRVQLFGCPCVRVFKVGMHAHDWKQTSKLLEMHHCSCSGRTSLLCRRYKL